MKFIILDVAIGSATGLLWLALLLLLGVIIVEWIVLLLFGLGNPGKLFLHSLIVNIASTILGYVLAAPLSSISQNNSSDLLSWLVFFIVTVIVEGFLLQVLNKEQPAKKVWMATFTMNLVSYLALYLLFGGTS
jgi:hypothetical protein